MRKTWLAVVGSLGALVLVAIAVVPLLASGEAPAPGSYEQHISADLDFMVKAVGILQLSPALRSADGSQRVRVLALHLYLGHGPRELGGTSAFEILPEGGAQPIDRSLTIFPYPELVQLPGDGAALVTVDARPANGKTWYDVRSEQDVVITIAAAPKPQ